MSSSPFLLNLDATFNQNEKWRADDPERYKWEIATMGCRTRVFEDRWGILKEGIEEIKKNLEVTKEIQYIIDFVESSQRGIIR